MPLAPKRLRRRFAHLLARRNPAFTATTRTRPWLRSRCLRPTVIGAACTRLLVNIAAALAPWFSLSVAMATAKSARPLGLMPAFTAAN
jgi:superfamily I DNA and RNA helicase